MSTEAIDEPVEFSGEPFVELLRVSTLRQTQAGRGETANGLAEAA
jgi:hypothetical protein